MASEPVRVTRSVCPACLREVDAVVVDRGGPLAMEKACPVHGPFEVLLARDGRALRRLLPLWERLGFGRGGGQSYSLYLTPRCGEGCPTCFARQCLDGYEEPSVDEVRLALGMLRSPRVSLFGGEPTEREDLAEVARAVSEAGGEPVLFTNGLRLADRSYCASLVEAGVREFRLELDSLDRAALSRLRGRDVLDAKLAALGSIASLGASAFLEAVVVPGVSDTGVAGLLELAARTPCVRGVSFRSYAFRPGPGGEWTSPLRTDELVALAEEATGGAVTLERAAAFQVVLASFLRLTGQGWCPTDLVYPLVREGGRLAPVHEVADVDGLARAVESASRLWRAHPRLAAARIAAAAATRLASRGSASLGASALRRALSALAGRQAPLPGRLVLLSFGAFCDPAVVDLGLVEGCPVRDMLRPGRPPMCRTYLEHLRSSPRGRRAWAVRRDGLSDGPGARPRVA